MRFAMVIVACGLAASVASAQSDDAAYCARLGDYATRYAGNAGAEGGSRPDFAITEAIDNCRKGNTAAGIAALENKIRSKGFTPPKR